MQRDIQTHLLLQIQLNVFGSACPGACLSTSLKIITSSFLGEAEENNTQGGDWEKGQRPKSKSRWKKQQFQACFPWKSKISPLGFRAVPPGSSGAGAAEGAQL